jgi:two-component system, chemotaxis family, response regulator PixH
MAREILVAVPDKVDQEEFRKIFETADYQLVFSDNGEDALLRIKLFKPDLIIAGAGLSERSGLELCEAVKTDSEFRQVPFVLLTGMFEEISEKERARLGADGIISKPLREGEILNLVEHLFEEKRDGKVERDILSQENGWTSLSELDKPRPERKQDVFLDGLDDEEEEIVDLVEVIEEPEAKMSIDDFVSSAKTKTESVGDIEPLESWDKLFEEEKEPEKGSFEDKPSEKSFGLSIEEERDTGRQIDIGTETKAPPEEELFEKIELEEILERVEQLKPSIEKEWPSDKEIDKRVEEALPGPELQSTEGWMELRDFETALKAGVKGGEKTESAEIVGGGLQPFSLEEPKEEGKAGYSEPMRDRAAAFAFEEFREGERREPPESDEKSFQAFTLEEPKKAEEKFEPAGSMKDTLDSFAFEEVREEDGNQPPGSGEKSFQGFSLEEPVEEEKAKPAESMFDEIQSFIRNELRKETPLKIAPELSEHPAIGLESERTPVAEMPQPIEINLEEESLGELAEEEFPDSFIEELGENEIRFIEEPGEEPGEMPREKREEEVKIFQEGVPSGFPHELESPGFVRRVQPGSLLGEAEAHDTSLKEVRSQTEVFDRQFEEVIGKGVQEMMEGFITKVLPQMTQNILNLTVERIETMVKEIVPDLAEKAIQEEIRRLQKGEKE